MRRNRGVHIVAVVQNDITQATPSGGSAAWARAFALLYDHFLWVSERAGIACSPQGASQPRARVYG
jgi:hypothetical protein